MERIIFTKYRVTWEKCDEKRAFSFYDIITVLFILFEILFSVIFLSFRLEIFAEMGMPAVAIDQR